MSATETTPVPKRKFRVVHGCHVETGPNNTSVFHPQGSILESDLDLCKLYNPQVGSGLSPKFEAMPDHAKVTSHVPQDAANATVLARRDAAVERANQANPPGPATVDNPNGLPEAMLKSIDGMTAKELKAYAAEEEVDLGSATTVEAMRAVLKKTLKP